MKILPQNKAGWLRSLIPLAVLGAGAGAVALYEPGAAVTDGRHDLGRNGAFMAHGWLAADSWFSASPDQLQSMTVYRDTGQVIAKLDALRQDGIQDLFPDMLPCAAGGSLPKASWTAAEMFAYQATALHQRVMPWIGGTRGVDCFPEKPEWRTTFVASCADLLAKCPHLSGVLVNIVPWTDGDADNLALLDALRQAMPKGKQVAVLANPPAGLVFRNKNSFWSAAYFRQVAAKSNLLVVRLHDSGLSGKKIYQHQVAGWTQNALALAGATPTLLAVADYEETTPSPAHLPAIENLGNSLRAIHGGLGSGQPLPPSYQGVALLGDHTLTPEKWALWRKEFRKATPPKAAPAPAQKPVAKPVPAPVPGPWKPEYQKPAAKKP